MKLLTQTSTYFAIIAILIFTGGGVVFYKQLHRATTQDADERLVIEKDNLLNYVASHHLLPILPDSNLTFGDRIAYRPIKAPSFAFTGSTVNNLATPGKPLDSLSVFLLTDTIKDTSLYNYGEKEMEPYRVLEYNAFPGDRFYRGYIFKALVETDDLMNAIIRTIIIIAIVLLIALILSNILISINAW